MPFDLAPSEYALRGRQNYLSGLSAEDSVALHYTASGAEILARRWRGRSGEVDLVLSEGDEIVFVEVKKSQSLASAAERLNERQIARVMSSAEEFVASLPVGSLTPIRIDAALVDGAGAVEIIPNLSLF